MSTIQKTTKAIYADALPEIIAKHGVTNKLAGPKIDKICLSMGVGRAVQDGQILNVVSEHLTKEFDHEGEEGNCQLQDPHRCQARLPCDVARPKNVVLPG